MQSAPDQVDLPHSIAVDSSGRIFVSARGGIKVFNNKGVLLFSFVLKVQRRDLAVTWRPFIRLSGKCICC